MALYVDGREFAAAPDKNLLEHLLSLGFDLPYFCWHPAMGSVGACRQCAVTQYRDEQDRSGRIVMACMTPAADGTRVGFDEPEARDFRARVIEWLMTNHPHDCPVCEEGGECHLQDMTIMTGHNYRRYSGRKRTYRNQYLGPFLNHEMNRCIACYRCVRFYQDYAGGTDLHALGSHNTVFFGRHEDGVLESEFSGNLAEVCPTGVFTDRTFSEHYVRKWDLQSAPSVCVHCSLGCNTHAQERYGRLRRIVNRYNGDVNGYFLCDRGRYGYGFVNSPERVRGALMRAAGAGPAGELLPADSAAALGAAAAALASAGAAAIGIGSPRASLEANGLLRRLVGERNFYLGVAAAEQPLLDAAVRLLCAARARIATLREAAEADAVLVLGENVTATAPRLALALRQAARQHTKAHAARLKIPTWLDMAVRTAGQRDTSGLFIATPLGGGLDGAAADALRATPADVARFGAEVARALEDGAPPTGGSDLAARCAAELARAKRPLIVTGTGCGSVAVLDAAERIARALGERGALYLVLPEANSLGAALLAPAPLAAALARAARGEVRTAVVLETDLFRRASRAAVETFRRNVERLIVIDHLCTPTARSADVVLPAATFAEGDGTLVSSEGRAQRFFQVYVPHGDVQESWRWIAALENAAGGVNAARSAKAAPVATLDEATAAVAAMAPLLAPVVTAAPNARFRVAGSRVNRETPRFSGRTAMGANVEIREPPPPPDADTALAFSMEGYYGPRVPGALLPYQWAPGWNSHQQAVGKFQDELGGHLRNGDPGVRLLDGRAASAAAPGPAPAPEPAHGDGTPAAQDGLVPVPLHRVFGGEELSSASPPIVERAQPPAAWLHPEDARAHGVADCAEIEIAAGTAAVTVRLHCTASVARGVVGVPADSALWLDGPLRTAAVRRPEGSA